MSMLLWDGCDDMLCVTVDINECLGNHGCSEHSTCVNFHGGYFCLCKSGYHGNGKRTCVGQ